MIAIEMSGRLGNQMFIYAFGLSARKRLGTPAWLLWDRRDPKAFEVPEYFQCASFSKRKNALGGALFRVLRRLRLVERVAWDSGEDPAAHVAGLKDHAVYFGYMQAREYFAAAGDAEIRSELAVRPEFRLAFEAKYGRMLAEKRSVVLHLRRTDYRQLGNEMLGTDLRLPLGYYDLCLSRIPDLEDCHVFVIGDDLAEARERYGSRLGWTFEENDPITDFQLLQAADVAVLSNSSFAWWAGYLGRPERRVFAPEFWLGFKAGREYPKGITAPPWTWVSPR